MAEDFDVDTFFDSYLGREDVQRALKVEQALAHHEDTEQRQQRQLDEKAVLRESLRECEGDVREIFREIAKTGFVHSVLYHAILDCKQHGIPFSGKVEDDDDFLALFAKIADQQQTKPENVSFLDTLWTDEVLQPRRQYEEEQTKHMDHPPPREEWVPGLSKGKRKLDAGEIRGHLELAERMRQDGNKAFREADYEMALTRFTQGVNTLNWIEGLNPGDTQLLNDLFLLHLKNQAQAALMCDHWNEAIDASKKAQQIDPDDMKAKYRKAFALHMLGRVKEAAEDYKEIIHSPYADRTSIIASRKGLVDIMATYEKNKRDMTEIIDQSVDKKLFSESREESEAPSGPPEDWESEYIKRRFPRPQWADSDSATLSTGSFTDAGETIPSLPKKGGKKGLLQDVSPPKLDREQCLEMLQELSDIYQSEEFERRLRSIRSEADFEEHRILKRLKKVLPEVQKPVLEKFGFNHENPEVNRRAMERCVSYWRVRDGVGDPEIQTASKGIMETIMGDCWE
ncbi:unnamed protein product [Vitrella brassicaformis CCMP3155]|uniref:Uncharacterized protein n=1 Tax=Vitrella brassicaformis (strain CCMP3155) TaxID=1169540 RepID=A0A0G4EFF8_VITBC|nr:unnamed protein product [Vitrella brassicaformis CCMP3155]|mmetsp:Transcript_20315/g.49359  ORF Transcript_20315/g.49359 Transcript_20315/m.49359 type:complete len:512 (-) Transcript_20315:720-2255(-)|eukprot:CEL94467.1 unnamed protein product [Vitrella brassicaformis CCMP3155]